MRDRGELFTCEGCGQGWLGHTVRFPCRDDDTHYCSCGRLLHEWNSTDSWRFTKVQPNVGPPHENRDQEKPA